MRAPAARAAGVGQREGAHRPALGGVAVRRAVPQLRAAALRARAVQGPDGDGVAEHALLVPLDVQDVEVQPVGPVDVLVRAAGVRARVEQGVAELPVVTHGDHLRGPVGAPEVDHADVLRVGVDHPCERGPVLVLGLGQQHPVVRGEGVHAHPVDDLDGVVVVAAAVAQRVGRGGAGRFQVPAQRDVDAGQALGAGRRGARGDLGDRDTGRLQRVPVQPQHVLLVDDAELELVAQHVLGAHRGAVLGRYLPAGVRSAGAVEGAAREHAPDAGVGPAQRRAVGVVVVVRDAQDVAELVGVHSHAGALGLGGGARLGVGPDAGGGLPGGPRHVPGAGRVAAALDGGGRTPGGRDVLGLGELHLPELLPGGRLVLARGQVEDEVVLLGLRVAHVGDPGGLAVGADVLAAAVADGAGARVHAGLDAVLVRLERHPVDAERRQLDAEPAAGVLHPVLVDGVAAVELARLVQEVPVERGDFRAGDVVGAGLRVAEDGRAGGPGDAELLVGVVQQYERALEHPLGGLEGGVGPVRAGDRAVFGPRHVVGIAPVLRVDGLDERGPDRGRGLGGRPGGSGGDGGQDTEEQGRNAQSDGPAAVWAGRSVGKEQGAPLDCDLKSGT